MDFREALSLDPENEDLKDQVTEVQADLDKEELYGASSSDDD